LSGFTFKEQHGETPKRNADIVVSAKRGEEVVPRTAIYKMDMEINLSMRVKTGSKSQSAFENAKGAIAETFNQLWSCFPTEPTLTIARKLTSAVAGLTVFGGATGEGDSTPGDMKHQFRLSFTLDAMAASVKMAQVIRAPH